MSIQWGEGESSAEEDPAALVRRLDKLSKINAVLMDRVERSMDQQGNAFSLFQTAIGLEAKVRSRTEELTSVLRRLEGSNEALVVAKDEAERANLSKTRFLAAASHDLLQPLNAARLSISVLSELQATDDARSLAGQIDQSLQTIEDLIKTLLDISKLDAGVVKPEVRAFPLDDVLSMLEASFAPQAAAKGLKLKVRPCGLLVRSDPMLLLRVLQNLVSNAVRYTDSGGVVVGVRRRGTQCFIDVVDTGSGISGERARHDLRGVLPGRGRGRRDAYRAWARARHRAAHGAGSGPFTRRQVGDRQGLDLPARHATCGRRGTRGACCGGSSRWAPRRRPAP